MKNSNFIRRLFRFNLIPYSYDKIITKGKRTFRVTINPIVAMIRRNSGRSLVAIIIRLLPTFDGKPSKSIVNMIISILRSFSAIANRQGIKGLVLYLKQVSVLTQQIICGYKIPTTNPRVKRDKTGIPCIFPLAVRNQIRLRRASFIRFSLTMASIYRDLSFKAKPNLESITAPYSGEALIIKEIISFIPTFVKLFVGPVRKFSLEGMFVWFPILKSSPQCFGSLSSTNPIVMIRSAGALTPSQIENLRTLWALSAPWTKTDHTKNKGMYNIITHLYLYSFPDVLSGCLEMAKALTSLYKSGSFTGKLGFKNEAAGKVRVYAMVDPWTQLVMFPIHRCLFKILKGHSDIDGTFDQLSSIQRLKGFKSLYSMDLSSATDRLPISIQTPLIQKVFNFTNQQAMAWQDLLIDRPYEVANKDLPGVNSVRYSVGQPMGALSSWAMLALTHHLIVQFAAAQCGYKGLFKAYCVLGDDIVIYNSKVAAMYHNILTRLGVKCNLSKSILSPKGLGLEFAKRTFIMINGTLTNVSPSPLKELAAALKSLPAMIDYAIKYKLSIAQTVSVAGFGFRVLGSLHKPLRFLNVKVRYLLVSLSLHQKTMNWVESFQHLRNFRNSEVFFLEFSKYLSEYIRLTIVKILSSIDKANAIPVDLIPKDVSPDGYGAHALPPLRDYDDAQRIVSEAFSSKMIERYRLNSNIVLNKLLDIQEVVDQGLYGPKDLPFLMSTISEVMSLESDNSRVTVRSLFERSDSDSQSQRPGVAKIFRQHQIFGSVIAAVRANPAINAVISQTESGSVSSSHSSFIPAYALAVIIPWLLFIIKTIITGDIHDPHDQQLSWWSSFRLLIVFWLIQWLLGTN